MTQNIYQSLIFLNAVTRKSPPAAFVVNSLFAREFRLGSRISVPPQRGERERRDARFSWESGAALRRVREG